MSKKAICVICSHSKSPHTCEVCNEPICKSCVQFLDREAFKFKQNLSPVLSHLVYCASCFTTHVHQELETYNTTLEKAKHAIMVFATHRKPIPILKKSREFLEVTNCDDRDEAILQLGFLATERDFNAVLELKIDYDKVRLSGKYKSATWTASGYPANLDAKIMDERESLEKFYHHIQD